MAKLTILYDYHDDQLQPFLMSILFLPKELDWSKSTLYVPLQAPFQKLLAEEIDEEEAGISVLLDDLLINPRHPRRFGISLSTIKLRHAALSCQIQQINQLWMRMCDIEDVLQMDTRFMYRWNSAST
ncbi:hypothetical protein GK047_14000 [Paenibacillus sp. SYP-B3998]|uniref:Uncharacterized protein n=1 Tax=Paenibacillus sp. SYP-B3998 TaxID=2678564 RepID=A0A6G3ZY21_9BACL|nr:hypothetical protein [Paenibacillus sp. SYP-B3998]NEW07116.1 hypothetical protein [Paenibacillus sp. SYP-B3998]